MIVSLTCDDLLFLCYQEVYRTKEEEMLKTLLCENAKPPLPGSRPSRCCGDASTGAPRRSGERREAIPTDDNRGNRLNRTATAPMTASIAPHAWHRRTSKARQRCSPRRLLRQANDEDFFVLG